MQIEPEPLVALSPAFVVVLSFIPMYISLDEVRDKLPLLRITIPADDVLDLFYSTV